MNTDKSDLITRTKQEIATRVHKELTGGAFDVVYSATEPKCMTSGFSDGVSRGDPYTEVTVTYKLILKY